MDLGGKEYMKWMTKKQKVVNQEKHITLNREMVDQSMNIEDKYSAGTMMLADDRMTGQR